MYRTTLKIVLFICAGLFFFSFPVHAGESKCEIWPAWTSFRSKFVSAEGRVIDRSVPQHITTSEGQSYALMFALIANDRVTFDLILRWTQANLANGDLTHQLPAWKWGKRADDSWGVLDVNAASDADLWMAYALGEAGRLWNNPQYAALAELLAARILREETAVIPGLGLTLLPGPVGFHPDETTWRLNPSYLPIQIMRRFAALYPDAGWGRIAWTSLETIVQSAPSGFAPEWIDYRAGKGFLVDSSGTPKTGFDSIRVYLWAGMLDSRDPAYSVLMSRLAPMGYHVASHGALSREIVTPNGVTKESTLAGFSSALLPFLKATKQGAALRQQKLRIVALSPLDHDGNYYDQALTLFGLGWLEGRYTFDSNGQFKPRWICTRK